VNRIAKLCLSICCALAIAGCGGGGGGTGENGVISITYSPDPLLRTIYQHNPGTTVTLHAEVHPLPSGTSYLFLEDPESVLVHGGVVVTDQGAGRFSVDLPIDSSLPLGLHTGVFTFILAKDQAATDRYPLSDSKVSYEITVDALVTAEIKVDGVTQANVQANIDQYGARTYRVTVHSGHEIEVIPDKSVQTWTTYGPQLTFTPMAGSAPSAWKAKAEFLTPGDDYAFGEIQGQRTSNGETVKVVLDVVP
jgi:hypothetical protein